MKKLFLMAAFAIVALSAGAQVYVGGSVGFWHDEMPSGKSVTSFSLLPEVGVGLNDRWAIGTVIGYSQEKVEGYDAAKSFRVSPYARYSFIKSELVSLFVDGAFTYVSEDYGSTSSDGWDVGLKPGLAVSLSSRFSIVAHFGFLGYKHNLKYKGMDCNKAFGLDLNGNTLNFGLYYSF